MDFQSISIAETIVHGVVFDPKNSDRVKRMDLNVLFASVGKLFDLLEEREVPCVLVGGIAMLAYVEGRNTQVIDLILSKEDLERVPEISIEGHSNEFVRASLGGLQIDILLSENQLFELVSNHYAEPQRFADRDVQTASKRGLLLLKLFALPSLYRQGQFDKVGVYESDIASLLAKEPVAVGELLAELRPLVLETDIEELARILQDIEDRNAKARRRFE